MTDTNRIRGCLDRARTGLLIVAGQVPAPLWSQRPGDDRWSAAEVIAHLTTVEKRIQSGTEELFSREPQPVPWWRRLHVPPRVSELRLLRVKTPLPTDSTLLAEKDSMLAEFAATRERTLQLLEANRGRDLRRWRYPHPFFGSLNGESWFQMLASHEIRHTKQLREIVQALQ